MARAKDRPAAKIIAGLKDAIAFAKGDTSRARITVYGTAEHVGIDAPKEGE